MARKVKAQRIEQLAEAADLNEDAELIVSSGGNTYRASIAALSAALGLPKSEEGSGNGLNGTLSLNQFTSEMQVKNLVSDMDNKLKSGDIAQDGIGDKAVFTKPVEINEDCNVYAAVYPDIGTVNQTSSIYFGIQVCGSTGQYATIASDVITSKSSGGAEGCANAAFKAVAGNGLSCRGFMSFVDNSITSIPNVNMQLKASLVKLNGAFGALSRSFMMTIGSAGTDLFTSNVIKFTENDLPQAKGYESGLVTVQGYFSLKALAPVYLQYTVDNGTTWQNLAVKYVGTTKTLVNFGTFYVQPMMQLRLATAKAPTKASISAPYAACTAIVDFRAISKQSGNEENVKLSSRSEVLAAIYANPTRVTQFGYNVDNTSPYFYANNLDFMNADSVMVLDPSQNIIQQIDDSGQFYYQANNNNSDSSWTISALGLTTLGMSTSENSNVAIVLDSQKLVKSTLVSSLTSIAIGSDVTKIEHYCFKDFVNLTSISIPATVKTIGSLYTFATTINAKIPSKLQKVAFSGQSAFKITSKTYNKVAYNNACENTFYNCTALTSLQNFEDCTVDAIGPGTFFQTSLSSINIPNTVKYIDWSAFSKTSKLSVVMIPSTVQTIANPKTRHINGSTSYNSEVLSWVGVKLSGDAKTYTDDPETGLKIRDEIDAAFNKSDIVGTAYNNGWMDLKNKTSNVTTPGVKLIAYDKDCNLITKNNKAYYCTFRIKWTGDKFEISTMSPDDITPKYISS